MMNEIYKGVASGFVATVVLSMAMYVAAGLGPDPHVIGALTMISHRAIGSPRWIWIGWAYHFVIGTLLWGALFGVVAWLVRPSRAWTTWATAVGFGLAAWVLMMVVVLPLAGAGFFAARAGVDLLYKTLILHVLWATVLGLAFFAGQARIVPAPAGQNAPEAGRASA